MYLTQRCTSSIKKHKIIIIVDYNYATSEQEKV